MARRGIELEVKFAPVGEATLAELAARDDFPGWRVVERHTEAQHNTYYDTAEGTLEANRCSLRRRVLDTGVEWTFKRGYGPGRDGVARRREINALVPRKAPDLPKCEPVRRAQKVAAGAPLRPLFEIKTTRRQIDLAREVEPAARVALALDRVRLDDDRGYEEVEVEVELLDGDEEALAHFALWLMRAYGLLPLRGSKRGRVLAWLRGEGLPVVAPALGLRLIEERVTALKTRVHGRPAVIRLASPRGSGQARALAESLLTRLPEARAGVDQPAGDLPPDAAGGVTIVEGPDALTAQHADFSVWVKVGLPQPLLARLLADAAAAGVGNWEVLRRCGEYVVPLQRRFLDPAAQWADLVVISNQPPPEDGWALDTPTEQVKILGWPAEAALARAGAIRGPTERQRDLFFRPAAPVSPADLLRVRLCADTAWVSFIAAGGAHAYEARPRVLDLLRGLGYKPVGEVVKERQRYRLTGTAWELALDHVAGAGHFCELRCVPDTSSGADPAPLDQAGALEALGLSGARLTAEPYRTLVQTAQAAFASPG